LIPIILAAATWLLLVAATVVYARRRYHYWQGHARHMQKSGYLVPPASLTARLSHRLVTRALVYLGVGPIKVSGRRELMLPGRKIYVANHQFNLDFAVCSVAARTCCPVMTKSAELKPPPLALLSAWSGSAIPVNIMEAGGGQKAFDASVRHLQRRSDSEFLIFPQGALFDRLQLEDFKSGAARLQKAVADATDGEPVWLIPMYIEYQQTGSRPISEFVFKKTRSIFGKVQYGATVRIGEPIAYNSARSIDGTTAIIYSRIANLQRASFALSRRRAR